MPARSVVQLAAGEHSTCAVLAEGDVWCWGAVDIGGAVLSNTAPYAFGGLEGVVRLGYAGEVTVATLADGVTIGFSGWDLAWSDRPPQVAVGALLFEDPATVAADVGAISYARLTADGRLYRGFVGGGTLSESPVAAGLGKVAMDNAGNWCLLDDAGVATCELGTADVVTPDVAQVALGGAPALLLTTAGEVQAWDGERHVWTSVPATWKGTPTALAAGHDRSCVLTDAGTVTCWGPAAGEDLSGLADVVEISGRYGHTCARTAAGEIWCWGDDTFGQCSGGKPAYKRQSTPVRVAGLPS